MQDSKPWYASTTIWAGFIVLAVSVAGIFGFTVVAEDQSAIIEAVPAIITGLAGVIAIIGRIFASKEIG